MFLDPLYFLLVGPAILLSAWASYRVQSIFRKYRGTSVASGISGAEAARELLNRRGLELDVEEVPGQLTDHYDPRVGKLRLSADVFHGRSLAAVGVAAHEAGHALQHAAGFAPLRMRQRLAPLAAFGSNASWWLILGGLLLGLAGLVKLGVVLFSAAVLFQLVTLPVEWNASARAKRMIVEDGLVTEGERAGVASVLDAAALTYVAAALGSVLTLLYYLYRAGLLGRRD
jgi:Zn-dependent membrane protease YugP